MLRNEISILLNRMCSVSSWVLNVFGCVCSVVIICGMLLFLVLWKKWCVIYIDIVVIVGVSSSGS